MYIYSLCNGCIVEAMAMREGLALVNALGFNRVETELY